MRTFTELLRENIPEHYDISHNPNDNFDKNKYYVKKQNTDKTLFIFDEDSSGKYLKIVEYIGYTEQSSTAIYDLSENNLISLITQYCGN